MKTKPIEERTIGELIAWQEGSFLKVNHEYQRAPVWKPIQKKMFIDSVLRGYAIPAFYFHSVVAKIPGRSPSETLYIIDGQQRIDALSSYKKGKFPLLDPQKGGEFKFPNFVKNRETPWAGKRFEDLTDEIKEQFLKQPVLVYEIEAHEDHEDDEIRDLFIRLQGGTPLSAQDKRDAWPGKFTEYVLRIGGKQGGHMEEYSGHEFFNDCLKGDSSKKREAVAQTYMLYATRRAGGAKDLTNIQNGDIDGFYLENIAFDKNGKEAKRYESILTRLEKYFRGHPKLTKNQAIHLILMMDTLTDDYAPGWESGLPQALQLFKEKCEKARQEESKTPEYADCQLYNYYTKVETPKSHAIQARHVSFMSEMSKIMPDLANYRKDSSRTFDLMARETIYYRDKRECQFGLMRQRGHLVLWDNAEIHHVKPHAQAGPTSLENGALVCKDCHPKSHEDVREFAEWWNEKREKQINPILTGTGRSRKGSHPLPLDGTRCQFQYKNEFYQGIIENQEIIVGEGEQAKKFKSFSAASKALTGHSRNGWDDWEINLPDGGDKWILAKYWRDGFTA